MHAATVVPRPWPRALAVLSLALLLGTVAALGAPDGVPIAVSWPVGAVAGVLLRVPRAGAAPVLVVAGVALWLGFRAVETPGAATLLALVQVLGIVVTVVVASRFGTVRPRLRTEIDIVWYTGAGLTGGLAVAVVVAVVLAAGGPGLGFGAGLRDSIIGGAALGLQHAASQLLLLPLFLIRQTYRSASSVGERVAQWAMATLIVTVVFSVGGALPVVFPVLAVMAWGARRLATTEAIVQMLVVASVAVVSTMSGHGPFRLQLGWVPHGDVVLLQVFLVCLGFVVVPQVMTVGQLRTSLGDASVQADRLERIVRSAQSTAIIATDVDGRIVLFNPAAERLLGHRTAEVLGSNIWELLARFHHRELRTELGVGGGFAQLAAVLTRPEYHGRELPVRTATGEERIHALTLSAVHDREGAVSGYVSISEDVTDRVVEQRALEDAVRRLREVDEAKDVFVSSVSHELRTPLAGMVGYLELLADGEFGELTSGQRHAVDRIEGNSRRLLSLIEDLLTVSRLGEETAIEARGPVDLAEVVRTVHDLTRTAWSARSLEVELSTPPDPVVVLGDPALLEQMVANLVVNAVKFTPDGGRVAVRTDRTSGTGEGDHARLVVTDTGTGIAAEELPQLFTRFFRSRRAQDDAVPGTGLGLSIVRGVVERHGGRIDVESAEGVGTTMTVLLPLAPRSATEGDRLAR